MTAVSNSSPICYLLLIDLIHLLPDLLGSIAVPESVIRELSDRNAPEVVREWAVQPPSWLQAHAVSARLEDDLYRLHVGERDAIALAESTEADLIILDEKAARQVARERGLRVTGLIGILAEAGARGMVDLIEAVERIRKTNFRISPIVLKKLLDGSRR